MSTSDLAFALATCAALLRSVGETFWASRIEGMASSGANLTPYQARQIVAWYGGMGSFNDLLIAQINGHAVLQPEEDAINLVLNKLRATIYDEASALGRS